MNPRADGESSQAWAYYVGHGRSAEFDRAVDAAVQRIAADPESLPSHPENPRLRRCRVRPFPYDLLFVRENGDVLVLSVWNHRRDPANLPA